MVLFEDVDAFLASVSVYDRLPVDRHALREYVRLVEDEYNDLPYHGIGHVLGVVRACVRLWRECGLGDVVEAASPADRDVLALAFIVAAAVHDAGHQGLTNDFLIRSHHPYAITFNDASPNESHHASTAFRILYDGNDFLAALSPEQVRLFRQTVITLVMTTDMARHHAVVSNLRSRDFARIGGSELPIVLQAAIKCADLSHVYMPAPDHVDWSGRLQQEMFSEGDRWKQHGWAPPSLMDRGAFADFASSQIGFFRYVVIPFLEALTSALPGTHRLLEAAQRNARMWQARSPPCPPAPAAAPPTAPRSPARPPAPSQL